MTEEDLDELELQAFGVELLKLFWRVWTSRLKCCHDTWLLKRQTLRAESRGAIVCYDGLDRKVGGRLHHLDIETPPELDAWVGLGRDLKVATSGEKASRYCLYGKGHFTNFWNTNDTHSLEGNGLSPHLPGMSTSRKPDTPCQRCTMEVQSYIHLAQQQPSKSCCEGTEGGPIELGRRIQKGRR